MTPVTLVILDLDTPRYFSDGFYVSRSSDSIGMQVFSARLTGDITFERSITTRLWANRSANSGLGAIELINNDRALDALAYADAVKGRRVRIFTGNAGDAFDDMTLVACARIDRVEPVGERSIKIVTTSVLMLLEGAIQRTLYDSGDDVAAEMIGRPRPIAIGHPKSCPIPLVDAIDYEYDCHDSDDWETVSMVRDGGYPLTEGTGYIRAVTTGRYGIEKLALPTGRVVADVQSDGPLDPVFFSYAMHDIIERNGVVLDDYIDGASLLAMDAACPWTISIWIDSTARVRDVMQSVVDSFCAFHYENALGKLAVGRPTRPADGTSMLTITRSMLVEGTDVRMTPDDAPGFSRIVSGCRNWYRYQAGEVVDGVSDADRTLITADYRVRAVAGSAISDEVEPIAVQFTGGRLGGAADDTPRTSATDADVGIGTLLDTEADCQALADHIASLYPDNERQRFYTVDVLLAPEQIAALNPWSIVTLQLDAFGLDAGVQLAVVSIKGAVGNSRVELTLWGAPEAS